MISTVLLFCCLTLALGALLLFAHARLQNDDTELVDAINALLPQTQCAQCGYPGCRPYAEAVAAGAPIDLCPPGGAATVQGLQALLGRSDGVLSQRPEPVVARIREEECIGCFLCTRACPVDAIIGTPGYMHTVIVAECTGCELCVPACPVDCIDLVDVGQAPASDQGARTGGRRDATETKVRAVSATDNQPNPASLLSPANSSIDGRPCIGCNRCEPVCPASLAPRELLWLSTAGKWNAAAELGLDRCIECQLCNRACPSDIPLAGIFAAGKALLAETARRDAEASRAKARYEARTARLQAEQRAAKDRRTERLARLSHPSHPSQLGTQ